VGARQVLNKALAEDKADLEKGTYQPGKAAGHVTQALGPLDAAGARNDAEAGRAHPVGSMPRRHGGRDVRRRERSALGTIAKKVGVDDS